MTPRTPQCEVFWALLSSSEHSGVPEDSKSPTFPSVGLHPHTWPKWGCDSQFHSRPQKVGNRPDLLSCKGRATYRWKALDENYNFALDHIVIQGLLAKLWGSKVAGVPFGAISGPPHGSPGKNSHFDVAVSHTYTTMCGNLSF
jgi:hypothetical protein